MSRYCPLAFITTLALLTSMSMADEFQLNLRYQIETAQGSGHYHRVVRAENWDATDTAVIVCDVWDYHHSLNAVRRLEEFAPRLNEVLVKARSQGALIIHSPSDCMDAYNDHPARARAIATPKAVKLPNDINSWCSRISSEEQAVYPLDQSDGGSDDDPDEQKAWAAKLKEIGRNPGIPWKKQSELISIDSEHDYISDRGDEVWSILQKREIKNVILTGVHVNMCVLGRPFGLRQLARNGMNVVLMRDMTDTMYNPKRWPYVSHFTGNDLIISHIERFICPTITSNQLVGGETFRFKNDQRPHLAIVMAEQEYETNRTLPNFAADYLGKDFRVSYVFADETDRNKIPGLEVLNDADLALISVRRRTLKPDRLNIVREFVAAGKPVIGIRTASHAFSLRNTPAPDGFADWPSFDSEVFGGSYTNHYGNKLASTVHVEKNAETHSILHGIDSGSFPQGGSLYITSPLASNTKVLLTGTVQGKTAEPVAWTYQREDGGQSFYTSLGQIKDFDRPEFTQLLTNAIRWAAHIDEPTDVLESESKSYENHWSLMPVPSTWSNVTDALSTYGGVAWYRCSIRPRDHWIAENGLIFELPHQNSGASVWFNGIPLQRRPDRARGSRFIISRDLIEANDANLLVVRLDEGQADRGWQVAPRVLSGDKTLELQGRWQFRIGDDLSWSNIPLPARYGTSTDIIFEP